MFRWQHTISFKSRLISHVTEVCLQLLRKTTVKQLLPKSLADCSSAVRSCMSKLSVHIFQQHEQRRRKLVRNTESTSRTLPHWARNGFHWEDRAKTFHSLGERLCQVYFCASLAQEFEDAQEGVALSFFFWQRVTSSDRLWGPRGLIRCLLRQLLHAWSQAFVHANTLRDFGDEALLLKQEPCSLFQTCSEKYQICLYVVWSMIWLNWSNVAGM